MYGSLPVAYTVLRTDETDSTKWWLKTCDEDTLNCVWTAKAERAHLFTSKSGCEDYITKYLSNRNVKVDQRVINPYAYAMYAAGGA